MKKIFLISIFYIFFFCSNSFAFLEFKQSKDISTDADGLRQINFKPDGTIMYVTNREKNSYSEVDSVIQYSLSTPFDISTATKTSSTFLTNIDKPHAIQFKPDGKVMYVVDNAALSIRQYNLTTAWDTSTLQYDDDFDVNLNPDSQVKTEPKDASALFECNQSAILADIENNTDSDLSSGKSALVLCFI